MGGDERIEDSLEPNLNPPRGYAARKALVSLM